MDAVFINQDPVHKLREELYGGGGSSGGAGEIAARNMIFSYADPEVVRQAKLEALEERVKLRMAMAKADSGDHSALTALTGGKALDLSHLTQAKAGKGSRDQVKALVVPPEVNPLNGEEVRGSSKLILGGQRRDYMRAGEGPPAGKRGVDPAYRTNDMAFVPDVSPKKAGAGAWAARRRGKAEPQQHPLMAQLQEGMQLAYVPVKVQNQDGVARNAFVSQAQVRSPCRGRFGKCLPPRGGVGVGGGMGQVGKMPRTGPTCF